MPSTLWDNRQIRTPTLASSPKVLPRPPPPKFTQPIFCYLACSPETFVLFYLRMWWGFGIQKSRGFLVNFQLSLFPGEKAPKLLDVLGKTRSKIRSRIRDENSKKNSGNFRSATFLTLFSVHFPRKSGSTESRASWCLFPGLAAHAMRNTPPLSHNILSM